MSVTVEQVPVELLKSTGDDEGKSTDTSSIEPAKVSSNSVEVKEGPPRKKRKIYSLKTVGNLCPIMVLNEIEPGLLYTFSETGPKSATIHHASVLHNNQTFKAEDRIKKVAKKKVADIVLKSILQPNEPSVTNNVSSSNDHQKTDFSSDSSVVVQDSTDFYCFEKNNFEKSELPQPKLQSLKTQKELCQSSPLYQLKRLKPGIKVEITKEEKSGKGSIHLQQFTAQGKSCHLYSRNEIKLLIDIFLSVEFNGQTCEGMGSSKKKALNAAAQEALKQFFSSETAKTTTETINAPVNKESSDDTKTVE